MSKLPDNKELYLTSVFTALGDPLIKGLTEIANAKPKDPVAFLASFLHNFPEDEKPRVTTQEESKMLVSGSPEIENNDSPAILRHVSATLAPPRPIEVITVDPNAESNTVNFDAPENAISSANRGSEVEQLRVSPCSVRLSGYFLRDLNFDISINLYILKDEHGQSMLHFAAARTHSKNAFFDLLEESDINLAYRDELYRTARDVSIQANVPENTSEIDKWVLQLAAKGKANKLMELMLEGYDHILDLTDEDGASIHEIISRRGNMEMMTFLESIPTFEESREAVQNAIRQGDESLVEQILLGSEGGRTLAKAKNAYGRTSLHIAVLMQSEEIVRFLAEHFPELLRVGDNLERTPLHYAMGVEKIESLSRILIKAGAKRVLKDLKGRQPSYYFMNKSDILRLKEEEEVY